MDETEDEGTLPGLPPGINQQRGPRAGAGAGQARGVGRAFRSPCPWSCVGNGGSCGELRSAPPVSMPQVGRGRAGAEQGEPPVSQHSLPGCGVCGHPGGLLEGGGPTVSSGACLGPPGTQGHQERTSRGWETCPLLLCGPSPYSTCPQSSWALGDRGAVAGQVGDLCPPDSTHACPLGASLHLVALNATRGPHLLTPSPARFLMPPWVLAQARLAEPRSWGRASPQPPAPQPGRVQPTHIWSQGSRRSGPSRSDRARFTKMSPCR